MNLSTNSTIENLQRSEDKFRRLVEGLSQTHCVFSHTPEGVFTYASPGFKTVFGFEAEEFIGRNWRELKFSQESMAAGNTSDELITSTGKFQCVELLYKHPSGEDRIIRIIYGPVSENGQLVAMEGVCEDVTLSRRIQDDLQKSEGRYRSIVQILTAGVWEYNSQTSLLWCSEEYFAMLGYSSADLHINGRLDVFSGWVNLLHPEDKEAAAKKFFDHVAAKDPGFYDNRFRLRRKDGSYVAIWARGKIIADRNGSLSDVTVGIHVDVSEHIQQVQRLHESEQRHREIFNATSEAIFIHDLSFRLLDVNETAVKMYGYPDKETMLACNLEELSAGFKPYGVCEARHNVEALLRGEKKQFEWMCRRFSGELFPTEVALSHSRIGGDERIIAVVRDISEKKKFIESAQRADKLESLGILAGGIAHDFNNLLGGIYGFLELALCTDQSPETRKCLGACITTMGRARSLTQQLLTFARGGTPDCRAQNLMPFVEDTVRFALSGSNVSCAFEIEEGLSAGNYDRNQLGQVVENIVINAVQAMKESGGSLRVALRNRSFVENEHPDLVAGRYVQISFKDSGPGINESILKQIYDPFFSTRPGGHGLGLATSYSIIRNHGGCIDVNTEVGAGTTFCVIIPASEKALLQGETEDVTQHRGHGIVIVMDDEIVIREVLIKNLESFGYTVVTAANGEEVLTMLQDRIIDKERIAAMLFDLTVPGGMGGYRCSGDNTKHGPYGAGFRYERLLRETGNGQSPFIRFCRQSSQAFQHAGSVKHAQPTSESMRSRCGCIIDSREKSSAGNSFQEKGLL